MFITHEISFCTLLNFPYGQHIKIIFILHRKKVSRGRAIQYIKTRKFDHDYFSCKRRCRL